MDSLDFISIILIAIGLSADCFAVAVSGSASMGTPSTLQILRTSLAFGVFQAMMPVLGWLAGRVFVDLMAPYDHWVAFALLFIVGCRMIWESYHSRQHGSKAVDISQGFSLVALSVATSIDALAVGLSFAFLEVNIVLASATIGIVALSITIVGFLLGMKVGELIGKRAGVIGGVVLIGIGLRIVLTHML